MEKTKTSFDENGFATASGFLSAFIVNQDTMECIGTSEVWVSSGTGLPFGAYLDAPPPSPAGHAAIRTEHGWLIVEDHRGQIVYDTTTKAPNEITELGPIPPTKTTLPPSSQFDLWSGDAWLKNEEAERRSQQESSLAEQLTRIVNANQQIAILKPAMDGGYAKPEHVQLLADWQRYRYELTSVPEQPGWPESPQWPDQPETII